MGVFCFVVVNREGVFEGGIEGDTAFLALIITHNGVTFSDGSDILDGLEELDEARLRGITCCWHIQVFHAFQTLIPLSFHLADHFLLLFGFDRNVITHGIHPISR